MESDDNTRMAVCVFPVPRGYTPDQAYEELEVFGEFVGYRWWKPKFWRMRYAIRKVDQAVPDALIDALAAPIEDVAYCMVCDGLRVIVHKCEVPG